jgi:peptidylprolyl isomerase
MRYSILLVPVAALGLLASCGDNPTSSDASTTTIATPATGAVDTGPTSTVVGALPKPEVKIPATIPTELVITDITEGTGPAAVDGDTVVVHYVGVRSADGTEFDNSFDRGTPFPVTPLGTASVIDGWNQGLVGVKAGGRRQLDIPADLAYGDTPQGDIIKAGDALTFVIDVVAVVPKSDPADAPTVSIPPTPNQTESTFTDLVVGDGAAVNPGQTVLVQLIEFSAADGKQLQSSWDGGGPLSFGVDDEQIPPSLANAVKGMKVGGRRQVSVPFAEAFGPDGSPDLGLPPSTDLIVVLDLVAVY